MAIDFSPLSGIFNKLALGLFIMIVVGLTSGFLVKLLLELIRMPKFIILLGVTIVTLSSVLGTVVFLDEINFLK